MSFKLYAIRVFSHQWEAAVAFYRDVIGLPLTFSSEASGWAEFDVGGASLAVERCDRGDPEAAGLVGRFVGVSLQVSDIEQVYQTLVARGVPFTGAPERQPWGGSLAHFRDPDGNVLTLLG